MRASRILKVVVPLLVAVLLAAPASAYTPATATVGSTVDISGDTDRGPASPVKSTDSSTLLFYSNNPEPLRTQAGIPYSGDTQTVYTNGTANFLSWAMLPDSPRPLKVRIYAAHTNRSTVALNLAIAWRSASGGSATITKNRIEYGYNYPQLGTDTATSFLNSSYSSAASIPAQWTYLPVPDPYCPNFPITLSAGTSPDYLGQNVQAFYDVTISSGTSVQLAVVTGPTSVALQDQMRLGNSSNSPKEAYGSEDHREAGLFPYRKNVNVTIDLSSLSANQYKRDMVGHGYYNQSTPQQDGCTYTESNYPRSPQTMPCDGWVPSAGSALNQYLPGNFAVTYHYAVTFTGSGKGAVMVGRVNSVYGNSGLVLQPQSGSAIPLGYVASPNVNTPWLVAKDVSAGTTVYFDLLVPGNMNLPYTVYYERTQ